MEHVLSKPDVNGMHVIHEDKESGEVIYCGCYRDFLLWRESQLKEKRRVVPQVS